MENIPTLIEKQIRASLNSRNITILEAATELASLVTDRDRKILIFQVGLDFFKNNFFGQGSVQRLKNHNDLHEFMRIIKNGGQTEDLIEPYRADYDATGQDDPSDYPEMDEPQVMQG